MTKSNQSESTQLAVIQTKLDYISCEVTEVKNLVKEQYVTKTEFDPVKKIVYGLVAIVGTAVVGALIALIIK